MTPGHTIRDVARATGLTEHTLRYYERIGLVQGVARAANGHRRYTDEDVAWIQFLTRLRATGMPVAEMVAFAALRRQGEVSVPERRRLLAEHHRRVEAQVVGLLDNLDAIGAKVALLERRQPAAPRGPETAPSAARPTAPPSDPSRRE